MANNHFPVENAGENTRYVSEAATGHSILDRYEIIYADLTDFNHPWRHDAEKLARVLNSCYASSQANRSNGSA